MVTRVLVVFLGLAVLCKASPPSSQDSLEERRAMAKFADHCPPGLWCGKKRGLKEQEANKRSLDEILSTKFAANCPPGLWCGKKRSLNEQAENKKSVEKLVARFAGDCPPGLWCGKKRQISENRFSSKPMEKPQIHMQNIYPQAEEGSPSESTGFPSNMKQTKVDEKLFRRFKADCPPGLWCGKKRSASEKLERRFSTICPPGLWCGK